MNTAPFTICRVENVITEESAAEGDYASSELTEESPADLRDALDALDSDCWDHIDDRADGTIICYPADSVQDIWTGEWTSTDLIIRARRPEWAARLLDLHRKEGRR